MKRALLFCGLFAMTALTLSAQSVERFVAWHMSAYPQSRLLDIYKSCFQDYMGAEHLVRDTAGVSAYLRQELSATDAGGMAGFYYEPCGVKGRFVRVGLGCIREQMVSEATLLSAFVRSANMKQRPSVDKWRKRWGKMVRRIERMHLDLPRFESDRQMIDSLLAEGKYAISHSPEFRAAYHPHYRIVERSIFKRELLPLIERKKQGVTGASLPHE